MYYLCTLPLILFTLVACDRSDGITMRSVIPVSSELSFER